MGVDIDGIEVALFNIDGEYFAISNRCAHQSAPLCKVGEEKINAEKCWNDTRGNIDQENGTIACPWHLWEWDVDTGEHEVSEKRIGTFDVKVQQGEILVRI